jgi:putative ABC transport system substrate-binding protein
MKRRAFITVLGGAAAAWPLAARAQQAERMRRVGVLMNVTESDRRYGSYLVAFQQALRGFGWIDGQTIRVEVRWSAGDPERALANAPELVALAPDVILLASTLNLTALQRTTRTIPVVFVLVSDPIAQGFVSNLAHPGGNITGFSQYESALGSKWVDLLKQIVPALARVIFMFNPDTAPQFKLFLPSIEAAVRTFDMELKATPVRDPAEIEPAIAQFSRPNAGLIIPPDGFLTVHRQLVVELAARYRLPAIYAQREFVAAGGLMRYGTVDIDFFRQAAIYVDRILRGTKPADLPVQQPTKFELVINLTAARALGIELPMGLMLRADEMIE